MRSEHPAVGAAGTTRFGDRTRRGTAASFRCARCGELADLVRVAQAGTTVDTGRPPGSELTATGLDLDCFLGTSRHPAEAGIVDAVQALIEQGNVDPVAIRAISWTLCDVTPFYCPECGLDYCAVSAAEWSSARRGRSGSAGTRSSTPPVWRTPGGLPRHLTGYPPVPCSPADRGQPKRTTQRQGPFGISEKLILTFGSPPLRPPRRLAGRPPAGRTEAPADSQL